MNILNICQHHLEVGGLQHVHSGRLLLCQQEAVQQVEQPLACFTLDAIGIVDVVTVVADHFCLLYLNSSFQVARILNKIVEMANNTSFSQH